MAIKDLQRSSERLAAAEKAKTALEQLMNKKEVAQDKDKEPETPKARTSEFKPITSALEQSRVKISEQESEIKHLRNQLSQATQGIVGPSEQLLKEQAKDLRELLEKEKRQRTEDQINWDKLTRELEEKTRKLRISQSNDNPALVQRRRRPPVH
ncbi:hypothetical protein BO94DRAFT_540151 [Aspergillus sclerotioniger CBS 115572]|uniref:Uncharacterized protein n=1 Tax=Aspergillus sclerotioniger CBS 115572 TaxID=1450535 RepID=A0A317V658_9EURO|nr:hypothetical protein BO94DRAFT_540151 [Aspergillus sclerotioniger CBS 115572]PWY69019.1 hypothetical protein BO94DRAFT_540151 [Aspergillus sclerotioniger CBS 115572]